MRMLLLLPTMAAKTHCCLHAAANAAVTEFYGQRLPNRALTTHKLDGK